MKELNVKNLIANLFVQAGFFALGLTFCILLQFVLPVSYYADYYVLITVLCYACTFVLVILGLVFYFLKKTSLYRLTIIAYILVDFFLILGYFLLKSGFFEVVTDQEKFQEYLQESGGFMDGLFIALQYLQVVILPIPSFLTLVVGTALFGPVKCFLYSFIAIVLGSITAFFIGRLLGYRAVAWIVGQDTLDKWLKKIKGKDYFLITAMFVLPFFPDDVLCFIAGLTNMTKRYFIIMVTLCRAFTCATTCFSFGFIPYNTWWGILLWVIIFAVVVVSFILFCKYQTQILNWLESKKKRK